MRPLSVSFSSTVSHHAGVSGRGPLPAGPRPTEIWARSRLSIGRRDGLHSVVCRQKREDQADKEAKQSEGGEGEEPRNKGGGEASIGERLMAAVNEKARENMTEEEVAAIVEKALDEESKGGTAVLDNVLELAAEKGLGGAFQAAARAARGGKAESTDEDGGSEGGDTQEGGRSGGDGKEGERQGDGDAEGSEEDRGEGNGGRMRDGMAVAGMAVKEGAKGIAEGAKKAAGSKLGGGKEDRGKEEGGGKGEGQEGEEGEGEERRGAGGEKGSPEPAAASKGKEKGGDGESGKDRGHGKKRGGGFDLLAMARRAMGAPYEFGDDEREVFRDLSSSMRSAARSFLFAAGSSALALVVAGALGSLNATGLTNGATSVLNHLVSTLLISSSALKFRLICEGSGGDIRYLLDGVMDLADLFRYLAAVMVTVAFIHTSTASARWPLITEVILVLCAISSLGRFLAVSGPRNGARGDGEGDDDRPARMGDRYVPENRSRFTTAFMPLLAAFDWMESSSLAQAQSEAAEEARRRQADTGRGFKFTKAQLGTLFSLVETMKWAVVAHIFGAMGSALLLLSNAVQGNWNATYNAALELWQYYVMAIIIKESADTFTRMFTDENADSVGTLMEGLGNTGLTRLFAKVSTTAKGVTKASLVKSLLQASLPVVMAVSPYVQDWAVVGRVMPWVQTALLNLV